MFSKFLNLNSEKQNRILNAAMKEFAQKGFDNASTNEIVKEANIAKGLLFHYFKDKRSLFLFLYDYCVELSLEEFYKKINLEERDFFKRLREAQVIKMELLKQYPQIFRFLEVAYMENSSVIKEDIDEKNKNFTESSTLRIFDGIDISKFKEDMDIKKILNIIIWSFQGFSEEVLKKIKASSLKEVDYNEAFVEADIYIEIFKKCFYK